MNKIIIDTPACNADRYKIEVDTEFDDAAKSIIAVMEKYESDGAYSVTVNDKVFKTDSVAAIMIVVNVLSEKVAVVIKPDDSIKKGGD